MVIRVITSTMPQADARGTCPGSLTVGFIHPSVGFAYEFDGDNRASKQLHTVRGEDPESGIYTVTTPTYYLHSTVLGQVVAELDAQGNKTVSHIYVQGMCLASDLGGGYPSAVVQWEYTDPVTGSKGASNIVPENWVMTELSTLGADVTYPPHLRKRRLMRLQSISNQ